MQFWLILKQINQNVRSFSDKSLPLPPELAYLFGIRGRQKGGLGSLQTRD